MMFLLSLLVLFAVWFLFAAPAIASVLTVPLAAVTGAVLTVAHVWGEERFLGNQEDINELVFGRPKNVPWPVSNRHNKWLHQGFIAWFNLACCAGALLTGEPLWLVPLAFVFLSDFVQHSLFNVIAWNRSLGVNSYVAGFHTAIAYGLWFLVWRLTQTASEHPSYYALAALGVVLIFGNLAGLAIKNRFFHYVP